MLERHWTVYVKVLELNLQVTWSGKIQLNLPIGVELMTMYYPIKSQWTILKTNSIVNYDSRVVLFTVSGQYDSGVVNYEYSLFY